MKKKMIYLFFIFMLYISALYSNEVRGLTNATPTDNKMEVIGKAKEYSPLSVQTEKPIFIADRENWVLVDSINFDSFIQPGNHIGISFDNTSSEIVFCSNFYDLFCPEAIAAFDKAPQWMRPELENIFLQLEPDKQLEWAEVVNNAIDPYIDEIAYSIANTSAEYLSSPYCYPEIFTENASYLYAADITLNYVEIVDYGTSITDDNYYSTTLYWKIDENGNQIQVEVPRDIYYMYLVHPKITDEIPAFIDPDIIESNTTHTNNIVSPEEGVFWRNFLFNYHDTGYPLLQDCLLDNTVIWDITGNTPDDAIHTLTNWINDSMTFTSNAERPHQPVRIYRKHIGRCGEHADITAAACRSALIPCTSILAISSDHTWNEFWDEGWHHWEPVNNSINNPLVYENGWGWNFASVFEIKSNGYLTPVTATYSEETATIIIYALDNNGDPIDGAKITLRIPAWDNWGYTDKEGKCTFIVGEGKTYYARMDSEIGNDPIATNQVYQVAANTINGQTYTYSLNAEGTMPVVQYNSITVPEDDVEDYKLVMDFTVPEQIITGLIIMDDLDDTEFYNNIDEGIINFFMTDLMNYDLYTNGQMFDTFNEYIGIFEGEIEFDIPTDELWYAFFDIADNLNNPQYIQGSARLYEYEENSIDDNIISNTTKLLDNYPNPFNPTTTISYDLKNDSKIKLEIFNIKGQKVITLEDDDKIAGHHNIVWNGKNSDGSSVSSGIYFYKLKTDSFSAVKKMILMM
ncbi:MAG: T9SS type A sorting domain-containing protein [Candidatus Cloacimonadota bacterium]|nr:T9SS type A sorting domain-containing protein [Candidatus Cloacimonadota bacterium]